MRERAKQWRRRKRRSRAQQRAPSVASILFPQILYGISLVPTGTNEPRDCVIEPAFSPLLVSQNIRERKNLYPFRRGLSSAVYADFLPSLYYLKVVGLAQQSRESFWLVRREGPRDPNVVDRVP